MAIWLRLINRASSARRGQMMPIFALTLFVFVGAMMLGIDLSRLRTEAESVQRAANAAALAGVVYLPDYQSDAFTRATEEAGKNGFVDGHNGVSVTPARVPLYTGRLQVTISEPVSLIFGQIFGLGSRRISRSAIAEYDQPLQLGAPDYVLGYANYQTSLITGTAALQNFYLIARGPYGQQENGDAYSQYFEGYSGKTFNPQVTPAPDGNDQNPCTAPTATAGATPIPLVNGCPYMKANPDVTRLGGTFDGYDYVVYNPSDSPLLLKIFDPYDEGPLNQDAGLRDSTGTAAQYIDQWGCDQPNGTKFCGPFSYTDNYTDTYNHHHYKTYTYSSVPVALQFKLSGPYSTLYDTSSAQVTTPPTFGGPSSVQGTCTGDCVIANPFAAGDDPAHTACATATLAAYICSSSTSSPYAYKFLNYALITHKGYYHIHVMSTVNSGGIFDGEYGTGGNVFGLAACSPPGNTATGAIFGRVTNPNPGYSTVVDPSAAGAAISNPYASGGWSGSNICLNPNGSNAAKCAYVGTDPNQQADCVHIFALQRMAIINELSSGKSIIPLGYVPAEYDGKTLDVNLYDVGDVSSDAYLQVLTPAGDSSPAHSSGGSNLGYPTNLPYTYSAAATDSCTSGCSGYVPVGTNTTNAVTWTSPITATDSSGNHPYNGEWLKIRIPMTNWPAGKTYAGMVNQFGGYWKVLYNVGGSGADTTTWEVGVNGDPVHLVSQ